MSTELKAHVHDFKWETNSLRTDSKKCTNLLHFLLKSESHLFVNDVNKIWFGEGQAKI